MGKQESQLRRELQAASAVNRQLHAQLDGSGAGVARSAGVADDRGAVARRSDTGRAWLMSLADLRDGKPQLVEVDGRTIVVEGGQRREVSSRLLAGALASRLGSPRRMSAAEVAGLRDAPPVEVVEGPSGAPFVIVGGQRLPIRGLPMTHPVGNAELDLFPIGKPVDLVASHVPRAQYKRAFTGRAQLDWLRDQVRANGGPVRGTVAVASKAARKARSALSR